MYVDGNPEKQLRNANPVCGEFIKTTKHARYIEQGCGAIVHDIGREWISKTKYAKNTGFLEWTKK